MTRKPLTDITWNDPIVRAYGLRRETGLRWDQLADLAYQLADSTKFDVGQARHLVEFAASGLPVVLTWNTHLHGGKTETKTTTVIIEGLHGICPGNPVQGRLRIRYCGFNHDVYLSDVLDVTMVPLTVSYS